MPQSTVIQTFTDDVRITPLYQGPYRRTPVNLPPSSTFAKGTVLGSSGATANDVQTLTVTGTPTGGTITVSFVDPLSGQTSTFDLNYNSSTAAAQTAIRAAIGNSDVAVTGSGALPGNDHVYTFSGRYAGRPVPLMTVSSNDLTGGTSPAASFAHTTVGRSAGTYDAYDDSDPATAVGVLEYDIITDADGRCFVGATIPDDGSRCLGYSAPMFIQGYFDTGDLTGLDANAVADLGRLVSGSVTDGVLCIYGA